MLAALAAGPSSAPTSSFLFLSLMALQPHKQPDQHTEAVDFKAQEGRERLYWVNCKKLASKRWQPVDLQCKCLTGHSRMTTMTWLLLSCWAHGMGPWQPALASATVTLRNSALACLQASSNLPYIASAPVAHQAKHEHHAYCCNWPPRLYSCH